MHNRFHNPECRIQTEPRTQNHIPTQPNPTSSLPVVHIGSQIRIHAIVRDRAIRFLPRRIPQVSACSVVVTTEQSKLAPFLNRKKRASQVVVAIASARLPLAEQLYIGCMCDVCYCTEPLVSEKRKGKAGLPKECKNGIRRGLLTMTGSFCWRLGCSSGGCWLLAQKSPDEKDGGVLRCDWMEMGDKRRCSSKVRTITSERNNQFPRWNDRERNNYF